MKNVILAISFILLVGCKNIVKEQPVVEKPTVHLVEPQNDVKTIKSEEVPLNVKMDPAPVSQPSTRTLPEMVSASVQTSSESPSRPKPEIQPVPSEIVVSANSAKAMIVILGLCGLGIFYFLIKNGKK